MRSLVRPFTTAEALVAIPLEARDWTFTDHFSELGAVKLRYTQTLSTVVVGLDA